jgi:hypothetical protein
MVYYQKLDKTLSSSAKLAWKISNNIKYYNEGPADAKALTLREGINIIQIVEGLTTAILHVEDFKADDEIFAKFIEYKGKAKFKLISVDAQVIEQFISKDLTTKFDEDWKFFIEPAALDILQNRTGSIVNIQDDVSVYFYPEENTETNEKLVLVDLNARKSTFINSIALPISHTFIGNIPDDRTEVAIHESSFRLLNILRVTDKHGIKCFFNAKFNIFYVSSELKQEDSDMYIKSRLVVSIIKGK